MKKLKLRVYVKNKERLKNAYFDKEVYMWNLVMINFMQETVTLDNPTYPTRIEIGFEDVEIMQYIGLKDKDGTEICEGDIVEYQRGFNNEKMIISSEMVRNCECCHSVFGWHIPYSPEESKIIGNIYENPELVNEMADTIAHNFA